MYGFTRDEPAKKPDMSNPRHLPICRYYLHSLCIDDSEWDSDFQGITRRYFDEPKNMQGCYCQCFKREYWCPFFQWMKENRRKMKSINGNL